MASDNGSSERGRTDRRTFLTWAGAATVVGLGSTLTIGATGTDRGGEEADQVVETTEPVAEAANAETERADRVAETPTLGANLNGRPHRLDDDGEMLEASETTWVRAFLDVRGKLDGGGDPETDPDVVALRKAAREHDCRLVVNLKWDFAGSKWTGKESTRVPDPGSERETDLFRHGRRLLAAIGVPLDVVVLGNEPMWETMDGDIDASDPPVVRFMRRAKRQIVRQGDHGDPTYLLGAFNQIGRNTAPRHERFEEAMLGWARNDDDVDGIDLHVHYGGFSKAEGMIADAREALPDGVIAVTEFSPVWRYARHVHDPIGASESGVAFCEEYGYDSEMAAVEYFEDAKVEPRTPGELGDFYEAMPWYNTDHVTRMYDLLAEYDVRLGCLGFLQDRGMRDVDWTDDWSPFHVNFLFQRALLAGRGDHPNYMDDYRRLANPGRHDR